MPLHEPHMACQCSPGASSARQAPCCCGLPSRDERPSTAPCSPRMVAICAVPTGRQVDRHHGGGSQKGVCKSTALGQAPVELRRPGATDLGTPLQRKNLPQVHTTWDDIGIEMVEEYDATTDQLLLRKVGTCIGHVYSARCPKPLRCAAAWHSIGEVLLDTSVTRPLPRARTRTKQLRKESVVGSRENKWEIEVGEDVQVRFSSCSAAGVPCAPTPHLHHL